MPGVNLEIRGDRLVPVTPQNQTETVLIIGTAQDGPAGEPIEIDSPAQAGRIFGPADYRNGYKSPVTDTSNGSDAGATLVRAIQRAIDSGATNILAVRVGGTKASTTSFATSGGSPVNTIVATALNPGRIYNQVTFAIAVATGNYTITMTAPAIKGGVTTFGPYVGASTTIAQLCQYMNDGQALVTFTPVSGQEATLLTSLGAPATVTLGAGTVSTAGTDGCIATDEDYESDLSGLNTLLNTTDTGIYDMLIGRKKQFSVAIVDGLHVDDKIGSTTTQSALTDFAIFLYQYSKEVQPAHGFMATRPSGIKDYSSYLTYINDSLLATTSGAYNATLRWNKAGWFLRKNAVTITDNSFGGTVDLLSYVTVVVGEGLFNHADVGDYVWDFAASAAALYASTPSQRSVAKKSFGGVKAYGPIPSGKYAKLLAAGIGASTDDELSGGGGYLCLQANEISPNGSPVIYHDPTAAARDYSLRTQQTVHLCNTIQQAVKYRLYPFLSTPYDEVTKVAMTTALINVLDAFANLNALRGGEGVGYLQNIYQIEGDHAVGRVRVDLRIWPAYAISEIVATLFIQQ